MRPLGFLTGVVLGSAASIALVLLMVAVVFAFSAGGQPPVGAEYPGLLAENAKTTATMRSTSAMEAAEPSTTPVRKPSGRIQKVPSRA